MSSKYFLITDTNKIISTEKRADYIKNDYGYCKGSDIIAVWKYDTCSDDNICVLYSPHEKIMYLIGCILNSKNGLKSQKKKNAAVKPIADIIRKYIPEFKGFEFINDVYDEYNNNTTCAHDNKTDIFTWLKNRGISIDDFIFSKKYIIITSNNDKKQSFANMINKKIIDTNLIKNIDEINEILRKEAGEYYD